MQHAWDSSRKCLEPAALLEALRPEVYVKGGDYPMEGLPEAGLLAGWGGRVEIEPYLTGQSTTALLLRIRGGQPPPAWKGLR